ncbi:hypothetical protein CPB97_009966, partial [Podila verticillata]
MIALISSGVGLLVIILVVSLLVVCQRRRRRAKQRNLFKGKGLIDPEKGGYSGHDDDDDDDGHPCRYGHNAHRSSSSGHKVIDTKPKADQYPSQQMSRSAASSFTPRHQHQRSGSRSPDRPHSTVSSPRQSECSFVELIPIEETPRLAHTALAMPRVYEVQEAMVAEVVVPTMEEVSETLVLELEHRGCSQETLVETPVPVSKSDAQIQTDSSTDVEAWPVKGPMSKRQLKKQRRKANRQAAWERRETAILKSFLARGGSVSRRHSKLGQGHH